MAFSCPVCELLSTLINSVVFSGGFVVWFGIIAWLDLSEVVFVKKATLGGLVPEA